MGEKESNATPDLWNLALEKAITVAVEAHRGIVSQDGTPYILHPLRLMIKANSLQDKIVAVLHDVVEDCPEWSLQVLEAYHQWPEGIIKSVDALTRREGESYDDFLGRIKKTCHAAVRIKLLDLYDNIDITRLRGPLTDWDIRRLVKYHRAIKYLEGKLLW